MTLDRRERLIVKLASDDVRGAMGVHQLTRGERSDTQVGSLYPTS